MNGLIKSSSANLNSGKKLQKNLNIYFPFSPIRPITDAGWWRTVSGEDAARRASSLAIPKTKGHWVRAKARFLSLFYRLPSIG